jgi:hypothetical protein
MEIFGISLSFNVMSVIRDSTDLTSRKRRTEGLEAVLNEIWGNWKLYPFLCPTIHL